jgi:outer membrane protein OmpA-like peptidoglycan-associated protein
MKSMVSTLALALAATTLQITPVDLSIATVPFDSDVDVTLVPNGQAEIRREPTITRVKVEIDRADPLNAFSATHRSWVVWAVSPEGEFENLGELEVDGRGAELETVTSFTRLGILVTAEPYFRVESPAATVAFRSGPARDRDVRIDSLTVEVGQRDYSTITLPPQGSIHPRISQARMAVAVAENSVTDETTSSPLRQARIDIESMEQLLRRGTPLDVVLGYANDAIRLSDLALREGRREAEQARLAEANQRVRTLEERLREAEQDRDQANARERDGTTRINELLAEIEDVREDSRAMRLERDSAERDLATAEAEIRDLRNPWPPIVTALVYGFGARQTPRGLVLTLPATSFNRDNLTPEGREWLARFAGTIAFGNVPEVWIEGHSSSDRGLEESEQRAATVRDYLVETGLPGSAVYGRGLGASAPIPGTEAGSDNEINERVEIIVREFGAL